MESLQAILGYNFKNIQTLKLALTHPSFSDGDSNFDYEKLEFLGDSVLSLIISEFLFANFKADNEGNLAKRRAALVNGKILSEIAMKLNIGEYLLLSAGESMSGGRKNIHNLENAMEAIIGAIYLDGGLEEAKKIVIKYWKTIALEMKDVPQDPKNTLQEWAQKNAKKIPLYEVIKVTGPSHLPTFEIKLSVDGVESVVGTGNSKKEAERDAASLMIKNIGL